MNIYHDIDNINIHDISYYKAIQNKIMHYKYFYKIIYNLGLFTLNTIIINVDANDITVHKENNIYKVSFILDSIFLEKLKQLESSILENINHITNKKISYSFNKYINKMVYTTNSPNVRLSLRISGIWESETQIGITSKLTIN